MSPLSTRLEQANREETRELLNQAKESLIGYALVHGHLPCPDCPDGGINADCGVIEAASPPTVSYIDDGQEDVVDSTHGYSTRDDILDTCAVDTGYLPFATLGVPGRDPWDRRFIYSVTTTYADETDGTGCGSSPTLDVSFEICSSGNVNIKDTAGNNVASAVPALVYSLGKNASEYGGADPTSTAELENWWTDPTPDKNFISDSYVQSAGTEFDDILIWIPPSMLMYRMVTAERLP